MSVPVVCALFLTAIAAYFDWRWQKIPNLLALTGWVIGAGLWVFLAAGVLAVVAGIGRYMQKGELHLLPGRVLHRLQEICHGEVSAKAGETRVCFAAMLFGGVLLRALQEWWWLH